MPRVAWGIELSLVCASAFCAAGCKNLELFDAPISKNAWEPSYSTHVFRVHEYEERHGYSRDTAERLANEDAFENYLRKVQRVNPESPNHP